MKTMNITLLALLVGGALGYTGNYLINNHGDGMISMSEPASKDEPLYWVAPMDANYQRDKPGKSPMGMDLVPVYANDSGSNGDKAGTVTIDPAVKNNLGVKSEQVKLERLSPHIDTVGYIAFDESRLWQTNVRVSGWVEKLYINTVGERVTKGQTIFEFYSPELVKAQDELLNAYRTGRKGLVKGATERLVSLGVDRAQVKAIVRAGKTSQTIAVKAAANGIVAKLTIREGSYLSPAQSIISAGPIDEVWVDAEIFERQTQWVKAGSVATMKLDAISGKTWQGKVDYVYPILDPKTRTLRVRLKFSNSDFELKPNMFANITIQPVTEESVLTVPMASVIRSGGMSRVVLNEGNGKYRSARIEVGREAGERVEVIQGLTQHDSVVTSAHFMLDSESSLSADLSRINGVEENIEAEAGSRDKSVWANGQITQVMAGHNMLKINHQPVPEWDWPSMTMNFTVASGVEISGVTTGQNIDFKMQQLPSGKYEITELKVNSDLIVNQVWVTGEISMLMADFGMITLTHQAVEQWGWSAGEMNFSVDTDVNLSDFKEGQLVRFLVVKDKSDHTLKKIELIGDDQ